MSGERRPVSERVAGEFAHAALPIPRGSGSLTRSLGYFREYFASVEEKLLAIYLNDHLAGAVLGSELTRRAARENRGTPLGEFLESLLAEILEDKRTLEHVLTVAGVRRSPVKPHVAWALEKVGRLKLNGRVREYSPLSRLLELEGLEAGIRAKRALWQALDQAADPRLAEFDFGVLRERAQSQLEGVEAQRLEAARHVLGSR